MRTRNIVLGSAALVVVLGGWYAFRPERLFINKTVNESFDAAPAAEATAPAAPMVLLAGDFHSNAHETRGTATIYEGPDGQRTLRLTDFETSNGPDVRVYLVAASDVNDNETVKTAGFIELGALKGNVGDQNYEVPADIDLAKYRAVTIWCRRFSVNFGTAPLLSGSGEAMPARPVAAAAAPGAAKPAPQPEMLLAGEFHSNAHETKGYAHVYQQPNGERVLRLMDFETSNGPDVRVYLVAATDVNENETVKSAGFIDLGALKGNIGSQNYTIPADVDLAKYRAVTIWCRRFSVNFGTAPLVTM